MDWKFIYPVLFASQAYLKKNKEVIKISSSSLLALAIHQVEISFHVASLHQLPFPTIDQKSKLHHPLTFRHVIFINI